MEDVALLSENGKILHGVVKILEVILEENVKLKRALCELDTGGGNYFSSRRDIAGLSGVPTMAISWDEHISKIKEKLDKLAAIQKAEPKEEK